MTTQFNQVNIPISDLFWSNSNSPPSYQLYFSFAGVSTPSWISIDSFTSSVVGNSDKMDVKYNIIFKIISYGVTYERTLILVIPKCPIKHWLVCTSSTVCISWETNYYLNSNQWIQTSEAKTVETMKNTASTAGFACQILNIIAVAGAATAFGVSSAISIQIIFWLSGFYQLLMTVLVLRYIIPDNLK